MKREITDAFKAEILQRRAAAIAPGGRAARAAGKQIIVDAGKECGYSYSNMTRKLGLNERKRSSGAKVEARVAEKDSYAHKVFLFMGECEADGTQMRITVAHRVLQQTGEVPEWVTLKMVHESIRRNRWKNEALSVPQKFHGRHTPLHMIQLDSSKSQWFQTLKNGRIVINASKAGKNIQRLMIGGAIDDFSRVAWFRYYRADGESEGYVRDLMIDAMSEKEHVDIATGECRRMMALCGMPKQIYLDRGSGHVSAATEEGARRMGFDLIFGANEKDSRGRVTNRSNKKGRGKVERRFEEIKYDFEAYLGGLFRKGMLPPEITLEWINREAEAYTERYNAAQHPEFSNYTRWELFEPAFEGIQYPPDDARAYFTRRQTSICRNRLFYISKELAFIAPKCCDEGVRYELEGGGKEYYLWYKNELIKLEPQTTSTYAEVTEQPELESDVLAEFDLKERFGRELREYTGGDVTMQSLPKDLADDRKEFFGRPRSVSEIKVKVRYFAEVALRTKAQPANVINFRENNQ